MWEPDVLDEPGVSFALKFYDSAALRMLTGTHSEDLNHVNGR
jgi:hypothetical protein